MNFRIWVAIAAALVLAVPADAGLQKGRTTEIIHQTNERAIGSVTGAQLDTILTKVGQDVDQPGVLYASFPTPDAFLNIRALSFTRGDASSTILGPLNGTSYVAGANTTIQVGTGATSGSTVTTDGGAFTLPTVTTGNFVRMVIVAKTDGSLDTHFSSQQASQGSLTAAGTLLETLTSGRPLGYVDLQKLAAAGFKTAGSAGLSALVENGGIWRFGPDAQYVGGLPITKGGSGQVTQTLAFNALDPLTTKGDLVGHDGTNSVRVPAGTNTYVLSADSAQTTGLSWINSLTLFTLDRPVVDDYIEVKEESSIVTAGSPSAGKVRIYAKDSDKKLYSKDSTGLELALGGSGGSGEINVIANSSESTNWAASGAGVTVATTSTGSDLPLSGVISTAIKLTPVSGTDYARYRWTQPASLKNRKLKVAWEQRPLSGYASGDFKTEVYKHSDVGTCTYSGGSYTEFSLSADVSGTSAIPNLNGKYSNAFDADSADCYELRIVRTAGTTALNLANVVVGPGIQAQGAIITDWVSYTPTGVWATNTSYAAMWRRVGDTMEVDMTISLTGAPTGTLTNITIPTGYTIDTASLSEASPAAASYRLGTAVIYDSSASATNDASVVYVGSNTVRVLATLQGAGTLVETTAVTATVPYTFATGDRVRLLFRAPIAEWADSGVLNVMQDETQTEWTSYTPVIKGATGDPTMPSVYTLNARWRRNGDDMQVNIDYLNSAVGTATAGTGSYYYFTLPTGYTIDTTKLTSSAGGHIVIGSCTLQDNNAPKTYYGTATSFAATGFSCTATSDATAINWSPASVAINTASGIRVGINARVPVTEWRGKTNGAVGFGMADTQSAGLVSTGTQSFSGTKSIQQGLSSALVLGADDALSTLTNSVNKAGRLGSPHFLSSTQPPLTWISADSTTSTGVVSIGGNSGTMNAATEVSIYTAANTTTTSGTKRLVVNSSGDVGIGADPNTGATRGETLLVTGDTMAINMSNNETNTTTHDGALTVTNFTTASRPLGLIYGKSATGTNDVYIGGGYTELSAATNIEFYTGTGSSTQTGTKHLGIDGNGTITANGNAAGTTNLIASGSSGSAGDIVEIINTYASAPTTSSTALFIQFSGVNDATNGNYVRFADGNDTTTGSIRAANATTIAFNTSSDARLKENVRDLEGGLAVVLSMKPRRFTWKSSGAEDIGFIAQELRRAYPNVVSGNPDGDVKAEPMQVEYGKLTPVLAAAIQDLAKQNRELDARLKEMSARLDRAEAACQ